MKINNMRNYNLDNALHHNFLPGRPSPESLSSSLAKGFHPLPRGEGNAALNASPQNTPSFGANPLQSLGRAFEFDGFNFSLSGLLLILYGATIIPRYVKARDKDEKREILIRDITTLTTLIFARRSIQNVVSRMCSKASGLALHTKPENHSGSLKKIYNYLRPERGIQPLTSEQIIAKYSKIQDYKNGLVDFGDFVIKQGGDIKKALCTDKNIAQHLKSMHTKWKPGGDFESAGSDEIMNMIRHFHKNRENDYAQIIEILKNPNNELVKKAKFMNSTFDFLTTLVFVPAILGVFLSYFNETLTKRLYLGKSGRTKSGSYH